MADKSSRLTIRLGDEIRAWLKAEGAARGLDEATFARMLLYERMNEPATVVHRPNQASPRYVRPSSSALQDLPPAEPGGEVSDATQAVFGDGADVTDDELAAAGEPRADETEIPADADGGNPHETLEALMEAGPTFFDEIAQRASPPRREPPAGDRAVALRPDRSAALRSRFRPQAGLQPNYGPGSKTRPIGVNHSAAGGNTQGDGYGNVLRDNMRHFGMAGTRSR